VEQVIKGPKKRKVLLFYGKVRNLKWNPGRVFWTGSKLLMSYSTQMGRQMLRKRNPVVQTAQRKWSNILPPTFQFKWSNTWDPERAGKEAGFIWQLWHHVVAVNEWRGRISAQIDRSYLVCNTGVTESMLHRFWECDQAKEGWAFSFRVLKLLSGGSVPPEQGRLDMKQALFAHRMPCRFRKINRLWLLIRGVTLWTIWIARNDLVFNQKRWSSHRIEAAI
jgi:hypothetical protein